MDIFGAQLVSVIPKNKKETLRIYQVPRVRVGTLGKVRAASSGHTLEAQQINKEEKK